MKMLICDDEIDVCDFLRGFFEEREFTVFTASDGEGALRAVKRQRPDIILLDIRMPKMDGIEVLKKIRAIDKTADIIMLTAVDDPKQIEEAYKLGAKDYITKPLILEELEKKICKRKKTESSRIITE